MIDWFFEKIVRFKRFVDYQFDFITSRIYYSANLLFSVLNLGYSQKIIEIGFFIYSIFKIYILTYYCIYNY